MTKKTRQMNRRSNPTGVMEQTWLAYVATLDVADVYDELHTRRGGLTADEVEASREEHGANLMAQATRTPAALRFLQAFGDPFVLILLALGAVSFATDVLFAAPGAKDPATPLLIAAMAIISVLLRCIQETRGADAAAALAESIETTCCVERAGRGRIEIPLDEVVVGDIVHLAAGDIVPADLRMVAARDLFVGQSVLTGESEAVEKLAAPTDGLVPTLEASNLAFLGTTVISGTGVGVAVRVGEQTELGNIAARLDASGKQTAYDRGIRDVSLLLVRLMLVVVPIVFAINVATKGNWLDALLFSLSVAVGLTPEMLPMIVTTCLAKGAVDLSRSKVVVKRLDAIQNLGSIDVLCCDKTGTLTEDRVVAALQADGHVVGFMGDGVNDAAAMRQADCGVSVDTGADVAKEAADIILLQKDLMVLERGVEGGRRTFANMNKYVKMTASSNFGNVFSVLVASAFLPFLPMTAVQLLFLNFVYDLTCIAMPWDNVDEDTLRAPRAWDPGSISSFMRWMGPISSVFDIVTFVLLFMVVCPAVCGGTWGQLAAADQLRFAGVFQAGWLLESMVTQVLAVHLLRTEHKPFVESQASWQISVLGVAGIAVAALMCCTPLGHVIDLAVLPLAAVAMLALVVVAYGTCVLLVRKAYIARYGSLL